MMKKFLLGLSAFAMLSACSATASVDAVSMAKYEQVKSGMSVAEVEAVLGKGEELSRIEMPNVPTTVSYIWKNPTGTNMTAVFQGDKLQSKAQFGLK